MRGGTRGQRQGALRKCGAPHGRMCCSHLTLVPCAFRQTRACAKLLRRKMRSFIASIVLSLLMCVARGEETLAVMELVADYQLSTLKHGGQAKNWDIAVFYVGALQLRRLGISAAVLTPAVTFWSAGLVDLADISASDRFHRALVNMSEENGWELGHRLYHADDHVIGQVYLALALHNTTRTEHAKKMTRDVLERFNAILKIKPTGSLETVKPSCSSSHPCFHPSDKWSWCDSLFMSPPTWLLLSQYTRDSRFREYAVREWWRTTSYLYDPVEHLYFRDSTFFNRTEPNGRHLYWSRGNGWVIAGLARMIDIVRADTLDANKTQHFVRHFVVMAERLLQLQSPSTGAWSASLLDPASYAPAVETSGTAFFTYAFAWGVNRGILNRSMYDPAARAAWRALLQNVDTSGRLTHVQPIGSSARNFNTNSTAPFGVGGFLMAGQQIRMMSASEASREQG